jgi:hypothetical protein
MEDIVGDIVDVDQLNAGIQPEEINTNSHFWNAFDHSETEVSARWIVRFCQERGRGWDPFTADEIEAYYRKGGKFVNFRFNRLIEPGMAYGVPGERWMEGGGWIIPLPDGRLQVTRDFVHRCYRSVQGRRSNA